MATWVYNNKEYITKPFDLWWSKPWHYQECDYKLLNTLCEEGAMIYHNKWDRLYYLVSAHLAGNGHRLKAWIIDIHTHKEYVCCLQDLEMVKLKKL